jgi:hypothetical protein
MKEKITMKLKQISIALALIAFGSSPLHARKKRHKSVIVPQTPVVLNNTTTSNNLPIKEEVSPEKELPTKKESDSVVARILKFFILSKQILTKRGLHSQPFFMCKLFKLPTSLIGQNYCNY